MLNDYEILVDLHTHTLYSEHAYSTVKENIDCAKANRLIGLAVTDHYYQRDDFLFKKNELVRMFFASKNVSSKDFFVISGGEFNLGQKLAADVNVEKLYKNVKWRLAGLHTWFVDVPNLKIEDVPVLFAEMLTNKEYVRPTAFAHIERELYKCINADDEKKMRDTLYDIVDIAVDNDIFLEINESSLITDECDGVERMKCWLERAKERNAKYSLGSDAHYCESVGRFDNVVNLVNEMGISKSAILNLDKYLLDSLF